MKTNKADKYFSQFIRLRAADENGIGQCITCGRIAEVKYMDCGHYIKRQFQATRYNEINNQCQCKHCNNFLQGNDAKFREYLVKTYGEDAVLLLESSKRQTVKRSKFELKALAEHYQLSVKLEQKARGLKIW